MLPDQLKNSASRTRGLPSAARLNDGISDAKGKVLGLKSPSYRITQASRVRKCPGAAARMPPTAEARHKHAPADFRPRLA